VIATAARALMLIQPLSAAVRCRDQRGVEGGKTGTTLGRAVRGENRCYDCWRYGVGCDVACVA
jgi:hypothetical protein